MAETNRKLSYWPVLIVIMPALLILLGAWADAADARRHGLPVPQLWQQYKKYQCNEP